MAKSVKVTGMTLEWIWRVHSWGQNLHLRQSQKWASRFVTGTQCSEAEISERYTMRGSYMDKRKWSVYLDEGGKFSCTRWNNSYGATPNIFVWRIIRRLNLMGCTGSHVGGPGVVSMILNTGNQYCSHPLVARTQNIFQPKRWYFVWRFGLDHLTFVNMWCQETSYLIRPAVFSIVSICRVDFMTKERLMTWKLKLKLKFAMWSLQLVLYQWVMENMIVMVQEDPG